MSGKTPNTDYKAETRRQILNPARPPYAGGKNWLGHDGKSAVLESLLLDGATMERLLQEPGCRSPESSIRNHFKWLEERFDLPVRQDASGVWRFDREHLGIPESDEVESTALRSREVLNGRNAGRPRQPDPWLRQQVERAAVEVAINHFTLDGYTVDSVERDNCGWDLTALRGAEILRLEVKGLSGSQLVVELTPNEYARMQEHRESYRLCVVINALADPTLAVFAYSVNSGTWTDEDGRRLEVETRVAARCRVAAGRS